MSALRFPWETRLEPGPPVGHAEAPAPRPRGRRLGASVFPAATSWTPAGLTVTGAPDAVTTFVAAAEGPGITPWEQDDALLEEDAFHRALAVPAVERRLSVEACRQLARQYREAIAGHRARAVAWRESPAGQRASPLDLHQLVPVPAAVLARGSADPAALAWCRSQWGVTQIRRVERVLAPGMVTYRFWALDGGELRRQGIARRWPALVFRSGADPQS